MSDNVLSAVPVLPAADVIESLAWWTSVCGFVEGFRDATPPTYSGISRGEARVHLARVTDAALAKTVGEQTMVRVMVADVDAFYAEYRQRGGTVHPNGGLQTKPWGAKEFGAIDPNGVCVTFYG